MHEVPDGMIRFTVPDEATEPTIHFQTRYGPLPAGFRIKEELQQWANENDCHIKLMSFEWVIDIPKDSDAALIFKLTWL